MAAKDSRLTIEINTNLQNLKNYNHLSNQKLPLKTYHKKHLGYI